MSIYLHDWKDQTFRQLVSDFEGIYVPELDTPYARERRAELEKAMASERWQGVEVLLASYSYQDYSADAFVLFRKAGKLYEVNGSHCSCHGLEGQWEPEETTIAALRHRLDNGKLGTDSYCGNEFAVELREVLDAMEAA